MYVDFHVSIYIFLNNIEYYSYVYNYLCESNYFYFKFFKMFINIFDLVKYLKKFKYQG